MPECIFNEKFGFTIFNKGFQKVKETLKILILFVLKKWL